MTGRMGFADRFLDYFVPQQGRRDVSLAHLSGSLGVRSVTSSDELVGRSGRTRWVDGAPHITLASGMTTDRRRWSWAHELAHVMLSCDGVYADFVGHRLNTGGLAEERLCDEIASALLVPHDALLDLEERSTSPSGPADAASRAVEVACRYSVPAVAAARRLRTLSEKTPTVISLCRSGQAWAIDVIVGAPFSSMRLELNADMQPLWAALDSTRPFRVQLCVLVDDLDCVVVLQGRHHHGEVWAEVKELHRAPILDSRGPTRPSTVERATSTASLLALSDVAATLP